MVSVNVAVVKLVAKRLPVLLYKTVYMPVNALPAVFWLVTVNCDCDWAVEMLRGTCVITTSASIKKIKRYGDTFDFLLRSEKWIISSF